MKRRLDKLQFKSMLSQSIWSIHHLCFFCIGLKYRHLGSKVI